MKHFNKQAAQGDMLITRIDALPEGVIAAKHEKGEYVLAHSETGHNHVVKAEPDVQFFHHANDNFLAYLVVNRDGPCIEHMRSFDTHEPLYLKQGIYEIRRQREYTPEGFRRVAD